jgi:hypothetical protein
MKKQLNYKRFTIIFFIRNHLTSEVLFLFSEVVNLSFINFRATGNLHGR